MAHFNELKEKLDRRPAVQAVAARQKAVIATGRMVYEWRKAKGLSQAELAAAIGTKQESISRIERGLGQDGPKLTTLAAIAKACDQRFIISGGAIDDVTPFDEADAETAWGILVERPTSAADATSAADDDVPAGGIPIGRNVDVCFVGPGYGSRSPHATRDAAKRAAQRAMKHPAYGKYLRKSPTYVQRARGELVHGVKIVRVDSAPGHKPMVVMELGTEASALLSSRATKRSESAN